MDADYDYSQETTTLVEFTLEETPTGTLSDGTRLTRQAITKHLRVMQDAGLVKSERSGRESLYELDPAPLRELQAWLARVSEHWDDALARLKTFVED